VSGLRVAPPPIRYSVFRVPPSRWLGLQTYCFFFNLQTSAQLFFFPSLLLESAPLLVFPPYPCLPLFSQSGCKSNRITLPFQIYLQLFFTPKSRPNHNYIGLQPKGCKKKVKIISKKVKRQGYKPGWNTIVRSTSPFFQNKNDINRNHRNIYYCK